MIMFEDNDKVNKKVNFIFLHPNLAFFQVLSKLFNEILIAESHF